MLERSATDALEADSDEDLCRDREELHVEGDARFFILTETRSQEPLKAIRNPAAQDGVNQESPK